MSDMQRVTFRFRRATEVYYLGGEILPSIGDLVTHGHELWSVIDVGADWAGPLVICEPLEGGHSGSLGLVESLPLAALSFDPHELGRRSLPQRQ
jgi:hypothetical protein